MNENILWQYDESVQAGADYAVIERAKAYDNQMRKIRNPEKRAVEIERLLLLTENDTVIDFGCGTGALTVEIARKCRKMICIDTSAAMLEIIKEKAKQNDLSNMAFYNAGFLTYRHEEEPADKIITSAAFHHLPDFWKVVALQRMGDMLKNDGILLLSDVIFSFAPRSYLEEVNSFLETIRSRSGEALYQDAVLHLKEEFSTFDWLMDEMLEHTGFEIVKKVVSSKTNIDYVCKKKSINRGD